MGMRSWLGQVLMKDLNDLSTRPAKTLPTHPAEAVQTFEEIRSHAALDFHLQQLLVPWSEYLLVGMGLLDKGNPQVRE